MKMKRLTAAALANLATVATAQDGAYGVSGCSVSTVYIPVTYTVTSSIMGSFPADGTTEAAPTTTHTLTITQTSTLTETKTSTSYLSFQPEAVSSIPQTSTADPSYVYSVNSAGVTGWLNGNSPSPGATLTTVTTTVVLLPVPPTDPAAAIESTFTDVQTVTPPAYTSTIYSFAGTDITSTSTSTRYVTVSLSQVTSRANITTTRASFPGVSSGGWNASSSTTSGLAANAAQTQGPTLTTMTVISYFGTGDRTTSTHTEFITTTVAEAYTTTISQAVESPLGTGYVTTITALPVTITPGTGTPLFSTKVTFPGANLTSSSMANTTGSSISVSSNSAEMNSSSMSTRPSSTMPRSDSFPNSSVMPTGNVQTSGNVTHASAQTQTSSTRTSEIGSSILTPASISSTVSSAVSSRIESISRLSLASVTFTETSSTSPRQITSTLSSLGSAVSPTFSANNSTRGFSSSGSLSRSSEVTAEPQATSTFSSAPAGSTTMSSSPMIPPVSSALYSYTDPSSSSSVSLNVANSFTSASKTSSNSPSLPSTLTTSKRPTSSRRTPNETASSSISLLSISMSTSSRSSSFADATSKSHTVMTGTHLGGTHAIQTQSVQFSVASNANTTLTTPSARNPFPPSSATAIPTSDCGEHGDFMANFDDLPRFLPTNNDTEITQAAPVFNPYHHLTFSDGYVYAPEPKEPYQPISQPHLAVFLANNTGRTASSFGSLVKPGEIGDGPREPQSAFWFDANSAFFGCDNPGPDPCTLVLSAYTWSQSVNDEALTYKESVTIPACTTLTNLDCQLHKVDFPTSFRGLTGLQIQAYTGDNDERMFYMDDLAMRWSNNSCAAGLLRQSSR